MAVHAQTTNPSTLRTRQAILTFFDGLEMVDPGPGPGAAVAGRGACPSGHRHVLDPRGGRPETA
jgi:hypothetical protein